uniref:Uncharacterized protein n=1 Tax=Solanum lycopersicum TaxID=4081 RepID=A0A3Q7IE13_SOLLC
MTFQLESWPVAHNSGFKSLLRNRINTLGQVEYMDQLVDSSENWEPVTIFLLRSSFQVKVHRTQAVVIVENFSKELSVKALDEKRKGKI